MPRRNLFIVLALQMFAALFVVTLVMEVLLRLCGISYPYLHTINPDLGFGLKPGAAMWQRDEGEAFLQVNSQGFLDREHTLPKPLGTLRIAFLGNSYVEADQVAQEKKFLSLLEQVLSACPGAHGKHIETLNFGIDAYSTAQDFILLRQKVLAYQPDVVVLVFFPGNDVQSNTVAWSHTLDRPYFSLLNGKLIENDEFRQTPFFQWQTSFPLRVFHTLIDHSRVAQVIYQRLKMMKAGEQTTSGDENNLQDGAYSLPKSADWSEAWDVTDALIVAMASDTKQNQASFLVAIGDRSEEVDPDPSHRIAGKITDFSSPVVRLQALGESHGFDVLSLAPLLASYAASKNVYLHGFSDTHVGHWNSDGHLAVATSMAPQLCSILSQRTK